MMTEPKPTPDNQLARPTSSSATKRKAKSAQAFNPVDLKADPTPKTSVDAVGSGDRNLTAAMVEVADQQFQHAARAYGDRCAQNMVELEAFVQQCQQHLYDGITLSLAQQFGQSDDWGNKP